MVSDLLMNEALIDKKQKQESSTKSEDSGHDSGQSSLNTGTKLYYKFALTFIFSGCESFSESSG